MRIFSAHFFRFIDFVYLDFLAPLFTSWVANERAIFILILPIHKLSIFQVFHQYSARVFLGDRRSFFFAWQDNTTTLLIFWPRVGDQKSKQKTEENWFRKTARFKVQKFHYVLMEPTRIKDKSDRLECKGARRFSNLFDTRTRQKANEKDAKTTFKY